jgi:hypothetical protein
MSEVARSLPSQSTSGAAASAGPAGPAGPTGRFKAVEAWAAEDEPELKSDGRRARARSPRAPWEPLGVVPLNKEEPFFDDFAHRLLISPGYVWAKTYECPI